MSFTRSNAESEFHAKQTRLIMSRLGGDRHHFVLTTLHRGPPT